MKQQVSASQASQQVSEKPTARTRHFRDLLVWQKSMELARTLYRETEGFPKSEVFGLRAQLRRAVVSIPSNIAEGHGRLSDPQRNGERAPGRRCGWKYAALSGTGARLSL